MSFDYPDRVKIAELPTPIRPLATLSGSLPVKLYVKRDDLTGMLLTGNKIRKLEFLLAEARGIGADIIITCGGVQSNHCRAATVASRRLGMRSVLFLRGEEETVPDGNLLINKLFGAHIHYITAEQYKNRVEMMKDEAERLRKKGYKPFVIPEGGSNYLGAYGYVKAMQEILQWSGNNAVHFHHIVCATGSGGTQAGLILGKKVYGYSGTIHGVNVCDDAAYFKSVIGDIIGEFCERHPDILAPKPDDINIIEGYKGLAYGVPTPEDLQTIAVAACHEGIILDPVYTAKAFRATLEESAKRNFGENKNVLFLHTGGIFGIFPKRNLLKFEQVPL